MAKKESIKDKKVKELLSELASGDEKRQIKAVKSLKVHGNETVIEPLLVVLAQDKSQKLNDEITDLINTTKSTKVPAEIAKALVDERFNGIRQTLLASIWNSGLDYRSYLGEIATAAVRGEMMDALECITIIENIDGALTEDQIFEPLLVLKQYLAESNNDSDSKKNMLREIVDILQEMNNQL